MVARSLLPEASHDTSVEAEAKEARIHPCKGRSLAWGHDIAAKNLGQRPSRFAQDSSLEEARFELSVPPRWRTQLARRFTRYRRGMTTVDTSAADPEIRWHGPFGRVSLR